MPAVAPTIREIRSTLEGHGITRVGVTDASVLTDARVEIRRRVEADLHDGMKFTFKNPERSTDPAWSMPEARSVVVAARPYLLDRDPPVPRHGVSARVGRYAWVDHYAPLRAGLREVARQLHAAGHRATVFADDNSLGDRAVAHRAGLGWFGKNANLLLPGTGSFHVLGSVVTTAVYEPAPAPVADGCGSCARCIDGCPTGAIVAPGVIDGRRCLAWVLQKPGAIDPDLRVAVGDRIYGCDDCQDVCPISVRLGPRNTVTADPDEVAAGAWVSVEWLLDASDAEIEERLGRWYIADRDMRWLRRNALVVAGNTADTDDRDVLDLLDRYRTREHPHSDALLAEHAGWAVRRLHERALVTTP